MGVLGHRRRRRQRLDGIIFPATFSKALRHDLRSPKRLGSRLACGEWDKYLSNHQYRYCAPLVRASAAKEIFGETDAYGDPRALGFPADIPAKSGKR